MAAPAARHTSARTKAFATRLHSALVDLATSAVPAAWL